LVAGGLVSGHIARTSGYFAVKPLGHIAILASHCTRLRIACMKSPEVTGPLNKRAVELPDQGVAPPEGEAWTADEVAAFLRVDPVTVWRLRHSSDAKFPKPLQISTRRILYLADEVRQWLGRATAG
jgi:predicted DNA-binding transcriptional regulator AlpA